jgi:predicted Zn-dependent protease
MINLPIYLPNLHQLLCCVPSGTRYRKQPYFTVRQTLGALLLGADRPADAEAIYRADLAQYPQNGWSLFGLAQSLTAQGKNDEVAEVQKQFAEAWQHADVTLTASRF